MISCDILAHASRNRRGADRLKTFNRDDSHHHSPLSLQHTAPVAVGAVAVRDMARLDTTHLRNTVCWCAPGCLSLTPIFPDAYL